MKTKLIQSQESQIKQLQEQVLSQNNEIENLKDQNNELSTQMIDNLGVFHLESNIDDSILVENANFENEIINLRPPLD